MKMQESGHKCCPLDDECTYKEVKADTGESIALEEHHQIAETNEHHHVNILEH